MRLFFWRKNNERTNEPTESVLADEVAKLRGEVAKLCAAMRQLVQLQSVANQKLDAALTGKATFEVL